MSSARIQILPAFSDNYMYLVADGGEAVVIDPVEAAPVFEVLRDCRIELTRILLTHHHLDHTAGCRSLKQATGCTVLGPGDARIPDLDEPLRAGQILRACAAEFSVMAVPGHTKTHLAYYAEELNAVFTGDTLFTGGCGRVMEGSDEQMFESLGRIASLPDQTQIYCGHEYTLENMEFAAHSEPDNRAVLKRLEEVRSLRVRGLPAVPATLAVEKATNPFLRPGLTSRAFAELRRRKDVW